MNKRTSCSNHGTRRCRYEQVKTPSLKELSLSWVRATSSLPFCPPILPSLRAYLQPSFKCILYVCPTPGRNEYSRELKSRNRDNYNKRKKVPSGKEKRHGRRETTVCWFRAHVQESWLTLWRWYYHAEPWRSIWLQRDDEGEEWFKLRTCQDKGENEKGFMKVPKGS